MYCVNCGQNLPDNAVYCSKCGTKILNSINKNISEVKSFSESNEENVIKDYSDNELKENEYNEKIIKTNSKIRSDLLKEINIAEEKKSIRLIICFLIAGLSAFIFLASLSLLSSSSEITTELLMTVMMSFAVGTGVLLGAIKIRVYWNKIIEQLQDEIKNFDNEL